ncbi:hypothetical protein [Modestobacter sp. Leaf380]|uniref:hypothetical protein n=1 Tax=Modestobacter sp. Leaf380 TaxID=1736356 RepID=UPI00138F48DF|nr:hypothetical protein [Modestobacter sp. Leaf380]
MWLWLVLSWSLIACAAGAWMGTAMRIADRNDAARHEVDLWAAGALGEHTPTR